MFMLLLLWSLLTLISNTDGFMAPLIPRVGLRSRRGQGCARMAADQDDEGYLTWLSKKVERAQRPPFVKIARARLTRDFAVLLMRTSYQVCDELDFVPMDEFQKQFFLLRQDEWLEYKQNFPRIRLAPCYSEASMRLPFFLSKRIKQGDLTDPDYFDFISFAQYASVAMAIRNGRDIFEEKVGAEGETRTVQRDPDFKDNGLLPDEHARRVGDRILAYCTETFGATKLAPVVGQGLSAPELQEGCERIMNLLRLNFYLLDYTVESDLSRGMITIKATAPATIWGQQVLVRRRDRPTNDFEAKAVLAYLRACGIGGASYSTAFNGLDATHTFRL